MHLWLQNKQILFGGCCSIFSNSIHSITANVSGLHFRTICMPSVYMLMYNTKYCVFQEKYLSGYFLDTEVLSASSWLVALEFPSAGLSAVTAKGAGKNQGYRQNYSRCYSIYFVLPSLSYSSISNYVQSNYVQRDEFCFPYFGCALLWVLCVYCIGTAG